MMSARYKKTGNWIVLALLLLCCLYALHDMQTGEGVGLYFSMLLGLEERIFLDVAVDVLGIASLLVLLYLPCKILGHASLEAYLRLLIGYLAMVPELSLSAMLGLFRTKQEFLWDWGFGAALHSWTEGVIPFLQLWVPLLLLMGGVGMAKGCLCKKHWYCVDAVCLLVLSAVLLLVPTAQNVLLYLMGYLLLLPAFDCWESALERMSDGRKYTVFLWGILLLRGIYRIVVLISRF